MVHYFKFQIPYKTIHEILQRGQFRRIIFYVDLPSICRGFYNKQVIDIELANYFETKQLPQLFFNEANSFYNNLLNQFNKYNPNFITFYDSGECLQNKTLFKQYKGDRSKVVDTILLEDTERELFKRIKNYYFEEFIPKFTINGLSKVIYTNEYEGDLIPYFIISNNLLNSQDRNTLNIILSTDKDLLQTCIFKNTMQCATVYKKTTGTLDFYTLSDDNAIGYIYKKFKRGVLTSKYIPLILSLGGDKADNIPGIPSIGEAKAYNIIVNNSMEPYFYETSPLPQQYEQYRDMILRNFKLINFDEQLKRIPFTYLSTITQQLGTI